MAKRQNDKALQSFLDFLKRHLPPSGSKESNKAKRPIAELFGVGTGAIQSWISGRGQPIAEKRLLTHLFLHEASLEGSNYPALKAKQEESAMLMELLGFRVMTSKNLTGLLDYKDEKDVQRLARGEGSAIGSRLEIIRSVHGKYLTQIDEARKQLSKLISSLVSGGRLIGETSPPEQLTGAVSKDDEHKMVKDVEEGHVLAVLAHQLLAVKPLAEEVASDRFTPKERKILRELAGGGEVLSKLADTIVALCGEEARKIVQKKGGRL